MVGLILSKLPKTHLFVYQGMVMRLACEAAPSKEIAAAVPDVSNQGAVAGNCQRDERSSHAVQSGISCRVRVHPLVGVRNSSFEHLAPVLVGSGCTETLDQGVNGNAAGNFAGRCPAHAIAQSEDSVVDTISKSIFVRGADLTDIRAASSLKIEHSSNIPSAVSEFSLELLPEFFSNDTYYRIPRPYFPLTSLEQFFYCQKDRFAGRFFPSMPASFRLRLLFMGFAVFCLVHSANANQCSVAQPHPLTEEQLALIRGDLTQAETLYRQKTAQQPKNFELEAGLIRTLLMEQKVDEAESTTKAALSKAPQSVELLTAFAEVQYRQGIPWEMEKTLNEADRADLCYPRLHLVLARYYRFNSYYASALKEIKLAHQLDPYDPDIRRMWLQTLPLKQRIDELKAYLASGDTDVDSLRRGQIELTMLQNRADSQSSGCHLASPVDTTDIPFTPIMIDAERIRGWGLDVYFNSHRSRLQVDTGASGLYISRVVAERAGLKPLTRSEANGIGDKGPQGGYLAIADSIKIGGLEFKNCVVEVSDRRNIVDIDGLIGMDVFSDFLVTLDFPWRKLTLGPLPQYPGTAAAAPSLNTQETSGSDESSGAGGAAKDTGAAKGPHDRYIAPEMKSWTTVYRVGHDMIVPTGLNSKRIRLFIIDTGAQSTSISPSAAREVTHVSADGNSSVKGVSGKVSNVYVGNSVTFRFAHLQQEHPNVLSFDLSGLSKDTGTEISGLIGFDMLGLLVVRIDYRDGLMDFQYSTDRGYQHIR